MKEKDYVRFRELFVYLSEEEQFRMYKPVFPDDRKLQADVFNAIMDFEYKYGNPIRQLKKNPADFAIYKPIIIGGPKGKPSLLKGLIQIWKWNHS